MQINKIMLSEFLRRRFEVLFPEALERLAQPLKPCIRVNTLRTEEKDLVERLEAKGVVLEKIPWTKYGYRVVESSIPIGATPEYLLGYYFLQDPASMKACEVLAPRHGEVVLDMAAAPGGKTTYLSQLMDNSGVVVALDVNPRRMKSLKSNVNRMGCINVITINMDATQVKKLGITFDRILIDAPCTGTGTAHKNPEVLKKGEGDLKVCTLQRELLRAGIEVLKPGGILVYSTCSYLPEENEFIVSEALEEYGLELEEVDCGEEAFTNPYGVRLSEDLKKAKRFFPWKHGSQGFFIARLRKS